jgi:hypothetical protein
MQLKTILNRVQKFKSFGYGNMKWIESAGEWALLIEIIARYWQRITAGLLKLVLRSSQERGMNGMLAVP